MTAELYWLYGGGAFAVLAAGASGALIGLRSRRAIPVVVPVAIGLGSVYLLVFQLYKWEARRNYVDLAAWAEIASNITRGIGPRSSIQDGFVPGTANWFSAHFTPLIYAFAPVLALSGTPKGLIVAQFVVLSTSLFVLYRYARRWLDSRDQALVIAAALVLYPTYQYIQLYEFEMLRFSIPLLLLAVDALERGAKRQYWTWLTLALLVREEVAITTLFLGVYAALVVKRRTLGCATASVSLAYFVVVTQVIMPALRSGPVTTHVGAGWFAALGTTPGQVLVNIIAHPGIVLGLVADPVKLGNLFMYGLPLLFLPALAWRVLLVGAGNVAVNLLSSSMTHTSYLLYYLSPAIVFIFVALVQSVKILGGWVEARTPDEGGRGGGTWVVLWALLVGALAANALFGPSPLSAQFWIRGYHVAPFRTQNFHYTQYVVTERDRELSKVVEAVPRRASVSAEQHILPLLYDRDRLRVFPDIRNVDYVVIDKLRREKTVVATVSGSWDGLRENPQRYYDWVEKRPDRWRLVTQRDGYLVYRRVRERAS